MTENVENSLIAKMQEMEIRLKLETFARSVKAKLEIILDDNLLIPTRIEAIDGIEEAIHYAVDNASYNGPEIVVYPHTINLIKGLISIAGKRMSEENAYAVLQHIHGILCAIGHVPYMDIRAPFITEICITIIRTLIKFRNELRFVEMCYKIFSFKSDIFTGCSEEIFISTGLISILANMITTNSMLKTVGESDRESFVIYALKFLREILDSCSRDEYVLPISVVEETVISVFHSILNSTTQSTIIEGHHVIQQFLPIAGKEMISLKFVNEETGLHYVLLIAEHTLEISKNAESKVSHKYIVELESTLSLLRSVVSKTLEPGDRLDKVLNGLWNILPMIQSDVWKPARRSEVHRLYKEYLEAVRALLLTLDVGDVEGTDVVDRTPADHAGRPRSDLNPSR